MKLLSNVPQSANYKKINKKIHYKINDLTIDSLECEGGACPIK